MISTGFRRPRRGRENSRNRNVEIVNPPLCGHGNQLCSTSRSPSQIMPDRYMTKKPKKRRVLMTADRFPQLRPGRFLSSPWRMRKTPHSAMPPRASVGSASAPTTSPSDGAMEADTS
jgi:hypothetical protein